MKLTKQEIIRIKIGTQAGWTRIVERHHSNIDAKLYYKSPEGDFFSADELHAYGEEKVMETPTNPEDWMPEARQIAALCWCDKETKLIEMDSVLAEAVAKRIANWMEEAACAHRNSSYYRGLINQCGITIGKEAHVSDDGSIQQDVLCAKVPELVQKLQNNHAQLQYSLGVLEEALTGLMVSNEGDIGCATDEELMKAIEFGPNSIIRTQANAVLVARYAIRTVGHLLPKKD